MPEELPPPPPFPEYDVSAGRVIAYADNHYIVRTTDGRVIGFPIRTEGSEANAEADITFAIANPPPKSVPRWVTRKQLYLGLLDAGLTRAAVAAKYVGNEATLVEMQETDVFYRDGPLIAQLAVSFNRTPAQVDAFFRKAATFQP